MELVVVLVIILLISAVALPTIMGSLASSQVRESARLLQATIAGARDDAIRRGGLSGFRLLPDPDHPLAREADGQLDLSQPILYNRVVPIVAPPDYNEGMVTVVPDDAALLEMGIRRRLLARIHAYDGDPRNTGVVIPTLILLSATHDREGLPNSPTSWGWNVRVGDKLQVNNVGGWYTVVGPQWRANPEGFVNVGRAGSPGPLGVEYLLLVNGRDDNGNGWADEGWDGVNNNGDDYNKVGAIDEYHIVIKGVVYDEWREREQWLMNMGTGGIRSVPYLIRRRPMPSIGSRELALPSHVVIDTSRSRLMVDRTSGMVDVVIHGDGLASYSLPYGVPGSLSMGSSSIQFALIDRTDIGTGQSPLHPWSIVTINANTGRVTTTDDPPANAPFSATERGVP